MIPYEFIQLSREFQLARSPSYTLPQTLERVITYHFYQEGQGQSPVYRLYEIFENALLLQNIPCHPITFEFASVVHIVMKAYGHETIALRAEQLLFQWIQPLTKMQILELGRSEIARMALDHVMRYRYEQACAQISTLDPEVQPEMFGYEFEAKLIQTFALEDRVEALRQELWTQITSLYAFISQFQELALPEVVGNERQIVSELSEQARTLFWQQILLGRKKIQEIQNCQRILCAGLDEATEFFYRDAYCLSADGYRCKDLIDRLFLCDRQIVDYVRAEQEKVNAIKKLVHEEPISTLSLQEIREEQNRLVARFEVLVKQMIDGLVSWSSQRNRMGAILNLLPKVFDNELKRVCSWAECEEQIKKYATCIQEFQQSIKKIEEQSIKNKKLFFAMEGEDCYENEDMFTERIEILFQRFSCASTLTDISQVAKRILYAINLTNERLELEYHRIKGELLHEYHLYVQQFDNVWYRTVDRLQRAGYSRIKAIFFQYLFITKEIKETFHQAKTIREIRYAIEWVKLEIGSFIEKYDFFVQLYQREYEEQLNKEKMLARQSLISHFQMNSLNKERERLASACESAERREKEDNSEETGLWSSFAGWWSRLFGQSD